MRYRAYGKSALETRVDYVESKLDDTIKDFREAITKSENNFKEAITKSESSFKEAIKDNKEAIQQLKSSFDVFMAKAESSRRWSIGLVITIAVAVIGFLLTNGL